jgi:GSH-dependent disulfide-bond oxidoreductase
MGRTPCVQRIPAPKSRLRRLARPGERAMIDLYLWTTPNGYKPLIMLEELGTDYKMHPINIGKGEQFGSDFLLINPNGKIPAIVDGAGTPDEVVVFESGAILIYLAEKFGRFLPTSGQARATTITWLMFQMGGIGPMFGQLGHFMNAKEKIEYAINRYRTETERLYGVLDKRLGEERYLAGEYSIADMATAPWANAMDRFNIPREKFPNVVRWLDEVKARPAVAKAMSVKLG